MQSSLRELARKVLGKDIGASEDIRAPEAHVITQATTQPSQATWDPRFRQLKYEPLRIPSSKRELKEEDASAHAELPETLPTKKQRLSDEMNAVDLPAAESTPPRKRQAPAKPKGSAADPPGKPALNLDELIALAAEENAESEIALSITSAKPTQPLPDAAIEDAGDWVVRMDEAGLDVAPAGPEDEEDAYLELKVPGSIAQCLRGYQRVGVRFLLSAYARGCGAILADGEVPLLCVT